ncbi:MAG TPA: hypothetical protein VGA61_14555 [Anaerolineae bacterium]
MTQADLTLPAGRRLDLAGWLTVERTAYGAVTLVALGLRLYNLAARPLGPAEAALALPAWQSVTGRSFDVVGASPLLFQLQRLLFLPFGGSDALARWPVALLGGLAPLLLFALRDRLGRGGALMAALFWALSPMAVFIGRLGLDYGLVPPLSLAFLAASNLYLRDRDGRRLTWAAIALGLLLVAGPGAYTVVVIALVAAVLWREPLAGLSAALAGHGRSVALALVFTVALAATGLLTLPAGLALATDLVGRWLRQLLPGGAAAVALPGGYLLPAAYPAWDLFRRLLISEPLLLGTGLWGALVAWRRNDGLGRMASLALFLALLIAFVAPGRHPGDLGLVILALALLAGPVAARGLAGLAEWRADLDGWLLFGISLALLISSAIALPTAFSTLARPDDQRTAIAVTVVAMVLALALWLTYYWFGNAALAQRVLPVLWLVVAGLWSIGQLTGLNFQAEPGKANGVLAQEAGTGWLVLRDELSSLAGVAGSGRHEAAIDLLVSASPRPAVVPLGTAAGGLAPATDPQVPMLLWELKDWDHLRLVQGAVAATAPVIITPVLPGTTPAAAIKVPANYSGMQVGLLATWRPDDNLRGVGEWFRWLTNREADVPPVQRQTVLWIDRSALRSSATTTGLPSLAPVLPAVPSNQPGAAQ